MAWKVIITDKASQVFKSKALSDDDLETIQTWAKTVVKYGPEKLQEQPYRWADHSLFGEWAGHRSSSFSYKGRIIYKVEANVVTVMVVRITVDHDYRKKEK
jgi:mRNA-degrading endonuclease YafQ of YafQ-DinJ toxin-antitoxin module